MNVTKVLPVIATSSSSQECIHDWSDCNCDCACVHSECRTTAGELGILPGGDQGTLLGSSSTSECYTIFPEELLRAPSELYVAPLRNGSWFAFNPLGDSGVAVLNHMALTVLRWFQSGRPIASTLVLAKQLDLAVPVVAQAVSDLYRLSLLTTSDWQPPEERVPDILTAWLHLTDKCNLRCTYCYLNHTGYDMTFSVGTKSIDAVFRAASIHGFRRVKLKFAGGEPVCNSTLLLQLHDYAALVAEQRGISLDSVVLSSGIGMTRSLADAMMHRDIRLMVSLDGLAEFNDAQRVFADGRGSFAAASSAIDLVTECGLIPDISITVTGRSVVGLPRFVRSLLDRGIPFSINLYRDAPSTSSTHDVLLSEQKLIDGLKAAYAVIEESMPRRSLLGAIADRANFAYPHFHPCAAGRDYVVIDARGNIAKCQMALDCVVGTIESHDIVELVRNESIGLLNPHVESRQGCKDCIWRARCAGGCPLLTHTRTGHYDVRSPVCSIYQAIFPDVVRLEALRIMRDSPFQEALTAE